VLRVGVDGRAFLSPARGIRRYTAGLVRALIELGEPIEVVALGGKDTSAIPAGAGHVAEPPHPPTNLGWTLVGLPRAARRAGVDLIHSPAYTAPFWAGVPVILTIHDVSYARHPEWYPYRSDVLRRTFYRLSARAATEIMTVSEFSADEIAAAYGIPRSRITVVPHGVGTAFAPAESSARSPSLPPGVSTPFLLHVGDLHHRRNLGVVVQAVMEVRRAGGAGRALSLVLAGLDQGVGDALLAVASAAGAPEAVVRLGPVSEGGLLALYRSATALVYPSFYEGFGLPLLEAMASGTPVIASRAASMPEVLGDAGILLDPRDGPGWTDAISRVVSDEALRAKLRCRGLARAPQFTWQQAARTTLDVYRRALGRN
jgi:glycosyltransferase involved in cell wall biosynthesis